jgi:hypothetical protein
VIIRTIVLLLFFLPALSFASEQDSSYQSILKMHVKSPIDFTGLAADAAQLRADYNNVATNLLSSDKYTFEQRVEFGRSLRPEFDLKVEALGFNAELRAEKTQYILEYAAQYGCLSLTKDIDKPVNLFLALLAADTLTARNLWRFLARSIREYASNAGQESVGYTDDLLAECNHTFWFKLGEVQVLSEFNDGICKSKYILDEYHYSRFIYENIFLHSVIVRKLSQAELPIYALALYSLSPKDAQNRMLSNIGSAFWLYYAEPTLQQKTTLPEGIMAGGNSNMKPSALDSTPPTRDKAKIVIIKHDEYTETNCPKWWEAVTCKELVAAYILNQPRLWRSTLKELPEKERAEALDCIINYCPTANRHSLTPYLEELENNWLRILNEEKTRNKSSFAPDTAPIRKVSKRLTNKEKKQAEAKKKGERKTAMEPVALTKPSAVAEPQAAKPIKVKRLTEKQKREARYAAKHAEATAIKDQIIRRAELKVESYSDMVERIQVTFDEGYRPCLEELQLYQLIWGPDTGRKTLCWEKLSGLLIQFGWGITYTGGSYTTLKPPVWFSMVKVAAPEGLGVHFRSSTIMVHHPHDEAEAPMPFYVIGFLREQLGDNIGMSDIVVGAMIRQLNQKAE